MPSAIGSTAFAGIECIRGLAILLGFLRRTVWGPIDSFNAVFNTSYGRWWFVALVLAVITLVWGQRITRPSAASIGLATTPEQRAARVQRTLRMASIELIFFGIFSMMILMRLYP